MEELVLTPIKIPWFLALVYFYIWVEMVPDIQYAQLKSIFSQIFNALIAQNVALTFEHNKFTRFNMDQSISMCTQMQPFGLKNQYKLAHMKII